MRKTFPRDWLKNIFSDLPFNGSHPLDPHKKDDSPEICGLVKWSYVCGSNHYEACIHSISSEEGIFYQNMGMKEPGKIFKNLMAFLLDLMIFYDGTVKYACGKFLIQFEYGNINSSVACNSSNKMEFGSSLDHSSHGEHIGTLAAIEITN